MSSRLERITLLPDDDEPPDTRNAPSRAHDDYYTSPPAGRSDPRSSSSKSRSKRAAYDELQDYENLNESAVARPVENDGNDDDDDDGARSHRRRPQLEDDLSYPDSAEASRSRRSSRPRDSARRRRNVPQGKEDLTEVAAPPPVESSPKRQDPNTLESQQTRRDSSPYEAADSPPSHRQKHPEDYRARERETPRYLTELYTVSYLIFFAIMGTLARLGTQWITFYPGTPIVTPVIWANFGGSFIFGFLAEDQALFRQDSHRDRRAEEKQMNASAEDKDRRKAELTKRKKAIPLYIGLATGFCGSYTSFSSFTRDVFLALSNSLPTPVNHPHPGIVAPAPSSAITRHDGYSFEAFLQVIIFTIALSIGGLIVGAQVAAFADPFTPRIHGGFVRKFIDPAAVFLGFGCWLGSIFLAIWPPDRPGGPLGDTSWAQEKWRGEVLFALVFAPLGCLLRFYVSLKLNGLIPAFPLGTFAVNMFGTAIEGMCYDLQHVGVGIMGGLGGGRIGCQVLQGVQDGFCGCLTTVSTWVGEINGLRRKHGWGYAFASVLGGFCLMVIIMGSVRWSVGFSGTVCDTGYPNKVHG